MPGPGPPNPRHPGARYPSDARRPRRNVRRTRQRPGEVLWPEIFGPPSESEAKAFDILKGGLSTGAGAIDALQIAGICKVFVLWRQSLDRLNRFGTLIRTAAGTAQPAPDVATVSRLGSLLTRMLAQCGLSSVLLDSVPVGAPDFASQFEDDDALRGQMESWEREMANVVTMPRRR